MINFADRREANSRDQELPTMNKAPLYSMSFEDAVLRELSIERDSEEVAETSVHLPRWMQISVEILHYEAKMSEAKLYTGLINHGTALLQHRFDDEIVAHQHIRRMMLRTDNEFAKDFLYDFKTLGDRTFSRSKKRTVKIPVWCVTYLGIVSNVFPIIYSSAIRLAMCHSLSKWNTIDSVGRENCNTEINGFEKSLNGYIEFCNHLLK